MLNCLKRLKKTAWKLVMRMSSRTFTKLLKRAQWIHFPSSWPIKYDNDRMRSHDVTGKKISSLGNRSACRRTPIGLDGFVLPVYFQLKPRKQQRNRSALVQHSSMCWGVFTVPVAKRQYVFFFFKKTSPSCFLAELHIFVVSSSEAGSGRQISKRHAVLQHLKRWSSEASPTLLCVIEIWRRKKNKKKQMQIHTHTHTHAHTHTHTHLTPLLSLHKRAYKNI